MGVRANVERFKQLRAGKNLTQAALAEAAQVSQGTIERLEQGKSGNRSTMKKIAAVLGVELPELLATEEAPDDAWRLPFADYFAAIREVFGSVRFLGLAHRVDEQNVKIEKMFVEPELCDRYVDPNLPLAQWPKRRGLLEALGANPKLVVLGDPGSGKSTIVNMIACRLADPRKNPWRQVLGDAIPVPIVLRELALPEKYSFDELLESLQQTELGRCLSQKDMRLVIDAVHEGRAIVLLDGIDELSDVARREALHAAVWGGIGRYMACRFVMTSRITGHEAVPFQLHPTNLARQKRGPEERCWFSDYTSLPLLFVVPFDNGRIESFALNWYRQREDSERRAKEKADALFDAVQRDDGTFTLARIPNLLTLMALIHRLEADLPHGKARLYAKIVETYLETIDNYRKLTERTDSLLDKKLWLARVAFAMQKRRSKAVETRYVTGPIQKQEASEKKDPQREVLIARKDLQDLIREGMDKSGKKNDLADVAAFIDHIQRRSGLLIERGADLFAFTHLSFQEYFAAWYMSLYDPRDDEYADFKRYVDDSAWLETFCFFFEVVADERQVKKEPIRQAMLGTDWVEGKALPKESQNRTMLLARLARDRYSGLDERSIAMARASCLSWDLQAQEEGAYGRTPEALRILVAGNPRGGEIVACFVELARMKKVTQLSLRNVPITDLTPLAGLTTLERLYLEGTPVTDLTSLSGLTSLESLDLDGTSVIDLKPLAGLTRLERLDLASTLVKDLTPLAGLASLVELSLSRTVVMDLEPLVGLTRLRWLYLTGTVLITAEELAAIKCSLPELNIHLRDQSAWING